MTDSDSSVITKIETDLQKYDAVAIGPGIGIAGTKAAFKNLLQKARLPIVLDADALNIIGAQKELLSIIPAGSVLTPHPKEFERLFGESKNDFERIQLAVQKSAEYNIIIVLKGHHTFIALPNGKGFFNNTGNAGMATAGSGDTLTGMLAALIAQGYSSQHAAMLGVYMHGLAGDYAASEKSMEAMIAGDIIDHIGHAFLEIGKI